MVLFRKKTASALSGPQQAALYYARKRRTARAEATVGSGGLRTQRPALGLHVSATIKVG